MGDNATITVEGFFPLQVRDRLGNMTRNNPKMRNFPIFNENVSLAKTFTISLERRSTFDLRFESFNMLNRTQFAAPGLSLSDVANFGLVRHQANTPRRMQFAVEVNWLGEAQLVSAVEARSEAGPDLLQPSVCPN